MRHSYLYVTFGLYYFATVKGAFNTYVEQACCSEDQVAADAPLCQLSSARCGLHSVSSGVKRHASLLGSSGQGSHLCAPHRKMHADRLVALIPDWHLYAWFKRVMTRKAIFRIHYRWNAGQSRRQPLECPTPLLKTKATLELESQTWGFYPCAV